jgi:hypothetical protein
MHGVHTWASVALSHTFSLAWNTTRFGRPRPRETPKCCRTNTQGDSSENTHSASLEDSAKDGVEDGPQAVAEDSPGSDLMELDTEEGEVDVADVVTEEKKDEGSQEQTVSSKDIKHSVIDNESRHRGGKLRFSPPPSLSVAEDSAKVGVRRYRDDGDGLGDGGCTEIQG